MQEKSEIVGRILAVLDDNRMPVSAAAKAMGVASTTLNPQMNGTTSLNLAVVLAFLNTFKNISCEWLMRGTGPKYVSECGTTIINNTSTHAHDGGNITTGGASPISVKDNDALLKAKDEMIAELKKDKENLMTVITALTSSKN